MIGRHLRRTRRPDVYLHPAASCDMGDLPDRLGRDLHLVVVPLTGSRRVDAAVLLDVDAAELLRVRQVLPNVALFVVTTLPATPDQIAAARSTCARLLPQATSEQICDAVLASADSHRPPVAA